MELIFFLGQTPLKWLVVGFAGFNIIPFGCSHSNQVTTLELLNFWTRKHQIMGPF